MNSVDAHDLPKNAPSVRPAAVVCSALVFSSKGTAKRALVRISYETSPYERWIAIRRSAIAIPLLHQLTQPLQENVLFEFGERMVS
jgi:hypothetical protein